MVILNSIEQNICAFYQSFRWYEIKYLVFCMCIVWNIPFKTQAHAVCNTREIRIWIYDKHLITMALKAYITLNYKQAFYSARVHELHHPIKNLRFQVFFCLQFRGDLVLTLIQIHFSWESRTLNVLIRNLENYLKKLSLNMPISDRMCITCRTENPK